MKCPVCKHETNKDCCPYCGFTGLNRLFLSKQDWASWMKTVVTPYRIKNSCRLIVGRDVYLLLFAGRLYGWGCDLSTYESLGVFGIWVHDGQDKWFMRDPSTYLHEQKSCFYDPILIAENVISACYIWYHVYEDGYVFYLTEDGVRHCRRYCERGVRDYNHRSGFRPPSPQLSEEVLDFEQSGVDRWRIEEALDPNNIECGLSQSEEYERYVINVARLPEEGVWRSWRNVHCSYMNNEYGEVSGPADCGCHCACCIFCSRDGGTIDLSPYGKLIGKSIIYDRIGNRRILPELYNIKDFFVGGIDRNHFLMLTEDQRIYYGDIHDLICGMPLELTDKNGMPFLLSVGENG